MEPQTAARYRLLDELRGLDLISMMLYHGMWDVVFLFGVAQKWYTGRPGFVWQQSICWVFILLSGFCLPLGHHPFRRGAVVFGAGALVTAVTLLFLPEDVVWFGVLTLLGSSMLLTAALDPLLRRVPPAVGVGRERLAPLRRSVCPPLGWMGRHSLVLYLLHQPVILGVLTVAFWLVRAG